MPLDARPRSVRPGTYTLLVCVPETIEVTFGAAGRRRIGPGWTAYTGSAFGPGGLVRLHRHAEVAQGSREVRHWHVDHLLGHDETRLEGAWISPQERIECQVHAILPGRELAVGASDCECPGHLREIADRDQIVRGLEAAHERFVLASGLGRSVG